MATGNLFLVTQTLQRLLRLNIQSLLLRASLPPTVSVTAMPPERVASAVNTVNLHLYHVNEVDYYKNMPPLGGGHPPVSRQPLVLQLYYLMTAHHEVSDAFDAETQQLYLGLAMKTFHDIPRVDDTLTISPGGGPPETVMPADLLGDGNHIDIAFRPLTAEESLAFWSSQQSSTARLAAYYEVRSVFLEPEPVTSGRGTVYDVGLFVSAGQAPRVDSVSALLEFSPPATTGLGPQLIETVPARATLATALPTPVNRVRLRGSTLRGDGTAGSARVVLRSAAWRELTPPIRSLRIDPASNPTWDVQLDEAAGRFDVQPSVTVDDGGGPVVVAVTPGIYSVSIEATRRQETRTGITRTTVQESNQVAFSIGARIDAADPPNAAGRIVVRIVNVFDIQATEREVQLVVDGVVYDEGAFTGVPAQDRGTFERQPGRIELHPLFDPTQPGAHPIRLVVDGADAQPFWVVTP